MEEQKLFYLPYFRGEFTGNLMGSRVLGNISFPLKLKINDTDTGQPDRKIILRGPGDVLGIQRSAIGRLEPHEGCNDYEANFFPFIEFVDPDFPWRYSLDIDETNSRVDPWLTLIVLSNKEIEEMVKENIKVLATIRNGMELLTVKRKFLPDPDNLWENAHLQLVEIPPDTLAGCGTIHEYIAKYPSRCCSRLFCFRRLEPATAYTALLVPTYQLSADAFLSGKSPEITAENPDLYKVAWKGVTATAPVQLPIYFRWTFMTSAEGDFEDLAYKLQPFSLEDQNSKAGIQAVDATLLGATSVSDGVPLFFREGALVAPDFIAKRRESYRESLAKLPADFETKLLNTLQETLASSRESSSDPEEDPLVSLPVYGRFFRKTEAINRPSGNDSWGGRSPWVDELNLDVRNRVTASLGTRVVQKYQEEFMRECWYQVGEIRKANEKLRLTKSGFLVGKKIEGKHIQPLSKEKFVQITAPFHAHFLIQSQGQAITIKRAFQESGLPKGITSLAFRKITNRLLGRREYHLFEPWEKARRAKNFNDIFGCSWICRILLAAIEFLEKLYRKYNTNQLAKIVLTILLAICRFLLKILGGTKAEPVKITPNDQARMTAFVSQFQVNLPPEAYRQDLATTAKTKIIPVKPLEINESFRAKFNLKTVLTNKLAGMIQFNDGRTLNDSFDPIMACPKINWPMYKPLSELSHEYFVPGVDKIENNIVTLMEENRRFIEAYLGGLNDEMNDEQVWNGFPTDRRGTVFPYFWQPVRGKSSKPDIKELHRWSSPLGRNKESLSPSAEPNLVLVIKGDIIRRYPSLIVYAVKITEPATAGSQWKYKFWSDYQRDNYQLPEGSSEIIQPLFRANMGVDILLVGFELTKTAIQGESRSGEYYFALQENYSLPHYGLDRSPSGNSQDLSWNDVGLTTDIKYLDFNQNKTQTALTYSANFNSATIAKRTYQRPVRVAFHQSELLGKGER